MTTLYVGARVEHGGNLAIAKKNKEINIALDDYSKLIKDIANKFHLYTLSDDGDYLVLVAGDFDVEHEGPEELDLPKDIAERLRQIRKTFQIHQ